MASNFMSWLHRKHFHVGKGNLQTASALLHVQVVSKLYLCIFNGREHGSCVKIHKWFLSRKSIMPEAAFEWVGFWILSLPFLQVCRMQPSPCHSMANGGYSLIVLIWWSVILRKAVKLRSTNVCVCVCVNWSWSLFHGTKWVLHSNPIGM